MAAPVRVIFLGGLGEIGRNCMVIEQDDRLLLIDCGLMFPDADMHGIDLVLPDFTWLRENADRITRIAYDQEVISHGFWTGNGLGEPAFYAYTTPEPEGFKEAKVKPDAAFYSKEMSEFLLKYEDVRTSENPDQAILDFLQTTYEAGANLAEWNRANLEADWKEIL